MTSLGIKISEDFFLCNYWKIPIFVEWTVNQLSRYE